MKKTSIAIIIIFFISNINAGDIINSAFITTGVANLGGDISIQFTVNKKKDCDSYTINTKVDYILKKIVVEVDYTYISSCSNSFSSITEFVNKQVLLEGIYQVEIKLDVPSDFSLSETITLNTIAVNEPFSFVCNTGFIPSLSEGCPFVTNQVCACDGQTYSNECEAYLKNKNGVYNKSNCVAFIERSSVIYQCQKYQISNKNSLANYNCSNDYFEGKELYLKYENFVEGDSISIYFKSNIKSTRLFLTKIVDNNIVCISESDESKLEYINLPYGIYYIIVDSKENSYYEIEFCVKNAIKDNTNAKLLNIYPNPTDTDFNIESNTSISEIKIYDSLGAEIYKNRFSNKKIIIHNNYNPGIYLMKIKTTGGQFTRRILIK